MIYPHPHSMVQWYNTKEGPRVSVQRNKFLEPWENSCFYSCFNGIGWSKFNSSLYEGSYFSVLRKRKKLPSAPIIRYDPFSGRFRTMGC